MAPKCVFFQKFRLLLQQIIIKNLMKKILISVAAMAALVLVPTTMMGTTEPTQAPMEQNRDSYAEIRFDTLTIDFGNFSEKDPVQKCKFTFKNVGTAPLIIQQAFASCGCTVPSYPKNPIKPGQGGSIDVVYNGTGKFPGKFSKTVTVRSNSRNEIVRLIIKGNMLEESK